MTERITTEPHSQAVLNGVERTLNTDNYDITINHREKLENKKKKSENMFISL